MNIEEEYIAKDMILIEWVSQQTGLSDTDIDKVVSDAYDKKLKPDLEAYREEVEHG